MKAVLVAGDVIHDFNLLSLPASPAAHSDALLGTVIRPMAGGAWHLQELVRLACQDIDQAAIEGPRLSTEWTPNSEEGGAQAFSIWSPHPRMSDSRDRVWRIERFLGCQSGQTARAPAPRSPDDLRLDLLVIDDMNLGFRSNRECWETLLERCDRTAPIVLKTTTPIDEGPLWTELMARYADRVTVVLDAGSLRRRHASISQGLSWDRTIEEFQREFADGLSARDLALAQRVAVAFGAEGAGVVGRRHGGPELEHFIYDPDNIEGAWHAARPGITFGATSIIAGAIARFLLDPLTFPLFIAASRALAAIRASHDIAAGSLRDARIEVALASFQADAAHNEIGKALHPVDGNGEASPELAYRSAFPHNLLHAGTAASGGRFRSDLLADLTGNGYEYAVAKAMEVVTEGISPALDTAPKARYGTLVTVDREEIERLNEVRRLILAYADSDTDHRPLSLAVFGPPGSGKSFAIKQLAGALFGKQGPALEFNLSQFGERDELHRAFEQVRDASVKGQLPLVFWDEFDADGLQWLPHFLAPMQDAEYRGGSAVHPFGKAIFVFAGGTCSTFQAFDRSSAAGEEGQWFRRLIDPVSGAASISPSVVRAFLRAKTFHHGARSIEAIVGMSDLAGADYFGVAELPSADLLQLHVTPDFSGLVLDGELELATVELVAGAIHESWRAQREKQGWSWGVTRDDAKQIHPRLVGYSALTEDEKEANRTPARMTIAKLNQIGYRIVPAGSHPAAGATSRFSAEERSKLIEIEHEIWLHDHLLRGYAYAEETNDRLRLHPDIVPFDRLSKEATDLDATVVDSLPAALGKAGYRLARITEDDSAKATGR